MFRHVRNVRLSVTFQHPVRADPFCSTLNLEVDERRRRQYLLPTSPVILVLARARLALILANNPLLELGKHTQHLKHQWLKIAARIRIDKEDPAH
jgi:hypothetical protein